VEEYYEANPTRPEVEQISRGFLHWLTGDPGEGPTGDLLRAVAAFELAVLEVKSGSTMPFTVLWDRDPNLVLWALTAGAPLPARDPEGDWYCLAVHGEMPGMVACRKVAAHHPAVARYSRPSGQGRQAMLVPQQGTSTCSPVSTVWPAFQATT
jgi:hypothetical protein